MARLPYLDRADLPVEHQDLLSRPINLVRALAHNPAAAKSWLRMGGYIRKESGLDARLREMAILQVGYVTRSPYEYSHHIKIGRDFGVSDDDIRAIADETEGRPSGLDPLAKLVLRGTREMTNDLAMPEQTYAALAKHLSAEHLLDLILTIAFYCGVVRVLATLEIDVEEEYRGYLDEFPLPTDGTR
jgi:alkylhydroperoxidase family enzyme